jgi:hypothetical protein
MTSEIIRILIAGSLVLHAIAHALALFALLAESLASGRPVERFFRSWLITRLTPQVAALVGSILWAASTAGFLVAAAGFWGLLATGAAWRQVAVASSSLSILGLLVRGGAWPGSPNLRRSALNTLVALTMNLAILAVLIWLRWPPPAMFGR